ncbi:cyclase family protein [Lentibacillus salicampi]|uniref:Cyclase family protein n=1 Tax=Lentibacillus salicampi TaxID=175306 RepID=A0A4Y9A9F8_9BACI|nr:cyclase family protein [Lentibacillus salicampi]TFJ91767.1 cyclase family protein [Lentibacillus salicampi]
MSNKLIEVVNLLKEKEWVDLTHAFGPDSPHFSAFPSADFKTLFGHEDGFFAQQFSFAGQYGTHIDAPIHFVPGDKRYVHELDLQELVLPLVVIDKSEEAAADPDFTLNTDDILEFEKENGEIEAGSFVALRTDWSKRWPDQEAFDNKDEAGNSHAPGWSVEALQFLFEQRDIKAIGHETFDTDSALDFQKNGALIAEYFVLDQDTFQVEVMTNLDKIPAKGAVIFNIVPKAKGASGFPVRSFAILP